ncbi:hypothetical protein [Streptacidiphilus fuscans]|uniref:Uncharacterized protein n=1 Tax=Streptacidiphilus fuscans TaxID=2789292 RepID=A0A931BBG6_9ACTN|nr:hypothetical protein [Streptacidiphilus fuscans]MBF9072556.1 hypothetical protein [Streptacidiphilus fuscans]
MTTEDDARFLAEQLLVAEAGDIAHGWRFLTLDNLTPLGRSDALLYEKALDTFEQAAGDRQRRHRGGPHSLTFGIRGDDADQRIAWLHARLEALNPPDPLGFASWDIRDGAR